MTAAILILSPVFLWGLFLDLQGFFIFVYFERGREKVEEGHIERETQNPKQAPGSELSAQNPVWG